MVAVTVNHEDMPTERIGEVCRELAERLDLPVVDALIDGADALVEVLADRLPGDERVQS